MPYLRQTLLLFAVILAVPLHVTAQQGDSLPEPPPGLERVLVISLDGARPDALLMVGAEAILALAARGAVTWEAQTVHPAVTLPAHASMLTGLSIDEHELDHNNSFYPCVSIDARTFVTLAQEAGYRAAMVVGKEKLCQFHQSDAVDYTFARAGDRSVVDRALELIADDYEVIFVHLPNPDYFGHSAGWMSPVYLTELKYTDAQVGRLLTALDENDLTSSTLVILTADHGGHDFSHGLDIPEDRHIPWIIAGAGVVPGADLGDNVNIGATAATVLWALGLSLPETDFSEPMYVAFGLD